MSAPGTYAIFTRRQRSRPRVMHAAHEGASATVCDLPIGVGSGLVRDGDYRNNVPCPRCWPVTTNERLVRELEEQGYDADFVAEAEAAMLDAMDEMGCS